MFNMIDGNFHIWQGEQGRVFISDESRKVLKTYATMDNAINALWLDDMRSTARALRKAFEAYQSKQSA